MAVTTLKAAEAVTDARGRRGRPATRGTDSDGAELRSERDPKAVCPRRARTLKGPPALEVGEPA